MIKKNKDGSYNRVQFAIIILIALISISIIGTLLIRNVEMPQWDQQKQIEVNNTTQINTTPVINDSGQLYWVNNETYQREGGGGGQGSYVTNYNATYIVGGGGGAAKSYTSPSNISNMSYVIAAGGGSKPIPSNTSNMSYVIAVGEGAGSIDYQEHPYINSTQGISTNTIVITDHPTVIQNINTSQNLTIADSITKVIDVFPKTVWILFIFIFLITTSLSGNGSGGVIFPLGLVMILWWLNILSLNSIITFIIPAIFIYYIIKMFSSDR